MSQFGVYCGGERGEGDTDGLAEGTHFCHVHSPLAPLARQRPIAFGATLGVASALAEPSRQLVVVRPDGAEPGELEAAALTRQREGELAIALTASAASAWAEAGFELLAGRAPQGSTSTAFACTDFVCRLPVTTVDELDAAD